MTGDNWRARGYMQAVLEQHPVFLGWELGNEKSVFEVICRFFSPLIKIMLEHDTMEFTKMIQHWRWAIVLRIWPKKTINKRIGVDFPRLVNIKYEKILIWFFYKWLVAHSEFVPFWSQVLKRLPKSLVRKRPNLWNSGNCFFHQDTTVDTVVARYSTE